MLSTHSEIEIFDDVINGEIEPIKLFQDKLQQPISYLKDYFEKCEVTSFIKYNSKSKKPHQEILVLPHVHPLACEYINQQTLQDVTELTNEVVKSQLENFKNCTSPGHAIFIKQKNHQLIGISHKMDWEELDPFLLKYSYYQVMLAEYVKNLKSNLSRVFYNIEDEVLKRLVNRTHTRLINFCNQAIEKYQLQPSDLKLSVKSNYSDKDCMAIIYTHINELINFIVNEYGAFLNPEAHVPYNAEILSRYQLEDAARKTVKLCKRIPVDDKLKQLLMETLNKLLNLDTQNRITFYEINYYSFFITELYQFISVSGKQINEDQLIIRLIELGFNHYEFIKYVNNNIEGQSDNTSNELYLQYLLEKRKEWEQCILCENKIFNKDLEPAHVSLMNWINSEIDFTKNRLEQKNSTEHKDKLEVDLSVSQLALITRLFHEVVMTRETSISETASYVVENYKTQNSASISLKSFKNNLYKLENNTINEVKSKLIAMVNRANEL